MNTFLTILAVLIIAWGWTLVCIVAQAKNNLAGVLKSPSSGAHRLSGKSSTVPRQASGAPAQFKPGRFEAARIYFPSSERSESVAGAPVWPGTNGRLKNRASEGRSGTASWGTILLEPDVPWIDYADPGMPDDSEDHTLARWLAFQHAVR